MTVFRTDEVVVLESSGDNDPPVAYGAAGSAHLVGSSPTGKWADNPGALATADGEGGYKFEAPTELKSRLFVFNGVAYSHNGTALVPIALPVPVAGNVAICEAAGVWAVVAPPGGIDGGYRLLCTKFEGAFTFSWELVV